MLSGVHSHTESQLPEVFHRILVRIKKNDGSRRARSQKVSSRLAPHEELSVCQRKVRRALFLSARLS